jgi:hypothetical protein
VLFTLECWVLITSFKQVAIVVVVVVVAFVMVLVVVVVIRILEVAVGLESREYGRGVPSR